MSLRDNKLGSRPFVLADLKRLRFILISKNPFLRLNGYEKFEALNRDRRTEDEEKQIFDLTIELQQTLRADRSYGIAN